MPDGSAPPPRGQLAALEADAWAVLLPHVRAALLELPDGPGRPGRDRLRGLPTGRLAGGKGRDRLIALLASDPELWVDVASRLSGDPEGAAVLAAIRDRPSERAPVGSEAGSERAVIDAKRRAERDREKLRSVRKERDEARRRAVGAEHRADALAAEVAASERRIAQLEEQVAQLRAAVDDAARERERAVSRERRRREAELAEARAELAEQRRVEQRRRTEQHRLDEQRRAAPSRPERPRASVPATSRLIPGRPSRLPDDVVPGTREAVELFLHRGRRVLVDGYNVTRQHQPGFDLEQQRTWLVGALANLARSRGVQPTVVFDGERSSGRGATRNREVVVRFTDAGITADDEIVLDVEATDDPVLVVTDDRELAARVRGAGADVIGTRELLWLL
jgi:hypothetical protein